MKYKLLALAVLLVSCKQIITIEPPPPNLRVYNSAWEVVKADRLESRAITIPAEFEAYIAAYNLANTDDQLFLVEGEAEITIEQAPDADAYIVNASTYEIVEEYLGVPRASLVEDRVLWRLQLVNIGNAILFVDRVPPAPEPPVIVPDYEKYAIYLFNDLGELIFETHCEEWESLGFGSIDIYFNYYAWAARQSCIDNPGYTCIIGKLWP